MHTRVFLRSSLLAATTLLGTDAAAGPLDVMQVEYGVATGVLMIGNGIGLRTDGLTITFPVPDYVDNDTYSYQVVQPDTDEASESFLQLSPTDQAIGFASAYADTKTLEVGHQSRTGGSHSGAAVARSNLRIKNNDLIGFINGIDFAFDIPAGSVELVDFSRRFRNVVSRVGATIDYVLLSPDPETGGGTFIETTGRLLDFFVDLNEGGELTKSDNAVVTRLIPDTPAIIDYRIDPFSGRLRLPGIPPRGELMIFYDMYAISSSAAFETLSSAFIGDPTNLTRDGGFRLVLTEAPDDTEIPAVPEPATLMLLGSGLVATAGWARARRRTRPTSAAR